MLCECYIMGYTAPQLPAHESRFSSLTEFAYHPINAPATGLDNHGGSVLQRVVPPVALSWLPINLCYEERELLDYCRYNSTCRILPS